MISPLEGGVRRRLGLGGGAPKLGSERSRGSRARRALLLLACSLTAIAAWLAFGASDISPQNGTPAFFSPAARAPAAAPPRKPDPGAVDLRGPESINLDLKQAPHAGLLFDVDSGKVLWQRGARAHYPIASLTKIMTALLVVDRGKPNEKVMITRDAIDFSGSAVGLPRGKRVPVEALMHAMLIQSGNDAAQALASGVAGSEGRFVRLMNRRAKRLGLDCTRFSSPDGLSAGNRSCAADLAALARLAMDEPRIRRIVRKQRAAVPFPIDGGRLHLATTNPLLRSGYPGTIGLKTGFTERAGSCLVGVVRRGERTLGAVLIDSRDPTRDARQLLDAAFGSGAKR